MEKELDQEVQPLSKRKRKKLAKEEKRRERGKEESASKIKKFGIWILIIGALAIGTWWLTKEFSKPLPGQEVADLGRDHLTDIAGITYNSNPPTSGPHFPVWAKKGVYDRVLSDGYLIHSLEHGYIVISYDCSQNPKSQIKNPKNLTFDIWNWDLNFNVYAHDEPGEESTDSGELLKHMKVPSSEQMSWFTPENPPEIEIELPDEFNSSECKDLVTKLSKFVDDWDRVIVVPRLGMDTSIALTAWTRIDKFEPFNENRIEEFINAYHNRGPEKTIE